MTLTHGDVLLITSPPPGLSNWRGCKCIYLGPGAKAKAARVIAWPPDNPHDGYITDIPEAALTFKYRPETQADHVRIAAKILGFGSAR